MSVAAAPCRQRGPPSHECLSELVNEQQRRWYVALEAERIGMAAPNGWRRNERQHDSPRSARVSRGWFGCASRAVGGQRWKKKSSDRREDQGNRGHRWFADRWTEMGASKLAHDCISAARTGIQDRSHHSRSAAAQAGLWLGRQPQELQCIPTATASLATFVVATAVPASRLSCHQCRYQKRKMLKALGVRRRRKSICMSRAMRFVDIVHNQGYVYLGNSFVAIAQWWADPARPRFAHEDKLLILCDAGGSNNCRSWLLSGPSWKKGVPPSPPTPATVYAACNASHPGNSCLRTVT